jgi:hypothetical protein
VGDSPQHPFVWLCGSLIHSHSFIPSHLLTNGHNVYNTKDETIFIEHLPHALALFIGNNDVE